MGRHLPYSLKPEFVRGCTMRCVFCSLRHQSWAEEKYEYMPLSLWEEYIDAVADWRPKVRIEIANRGEPTIHPDFIPMIKYARKVLPKAQMLVSTNGDLSDDLGLEAYGEWIDEAMAAGVNCFLLDCYTPKRLRDFTKLFEDTADTFFGKEGEEPLNPYPYRGPDWKALSIKDACPHKPPQLGLLKEHPVVLENRILQYHNQGGNAVVDGPAAKIYNIPVLTEPMERMCVRPFREMPIWYDGSVPLCCDDWADKHIVGKFPEYSLPELWDMYDPARRELVKKNRGGVSPCDKCSERQGQRFGLELGWFNDDPD